MALQDRKPQPRKKDVNLFLPGIENLEFLKNENTALVYLDPSNGNLPVDQVHPGAAGMAAGLGCRDCHKAAGGGMSMEVLVLRRGGVNSVRQPPQPPPALVVIEGARRTCLPAVLLRGGTTEIHGALERVAYAPPTVRIRRATSEYEPTMSSPLRFSRSASCSEASKIPKRPIAPRRAGIIAPLDCETGGKRIRISCFQRRSPWHGYCLFNDTAGGGRMPLVRCAVSTHHESRSSERWMPQSSQRLRIYR